MRTRAPMTRHSSNRRAIVANVSSAGLSCSNRSLPAPAAAAGTTRTRIEPASAPSPAATQWTRATSGAAERPEENRPTDLRVLDVLAIDSTRRGPPVFYGGDERDRRLQGCDGPPGH